MSGGALTVQRRREFYSIPAPPAVTATSASFKKRKSSGPAPAKKVYVNEFATIDDEEEEEEGVTLNSSSTRSVTSSRSRSSSGRRSGSASTTSLSGMTADEEDVSDVGTNSDEQRHGIVRSRISEREEVSAEASPGPQRADREQRVQQLEQALRTTPPTATALRKRLETELAALRAQIGAPALPAAALVPPPVPAAPPAPAAAPARAECGMCRAVFAIRFDLEQRSGARDKKDASSARTIDARLANGELVSNQFAKIIQFEFYMRGHMNDDALIDHLIFMHNELIVKPSAKFGIDCAPWTVPMLQEHFATHNEHTFDRVREVRSELKRCREVLNKIEGRIMVPCAGNPALMLLDPRAATAYEKVAKLRVLLIDKLSQYDAERHGTAAVEAMFALANSMNGATMRESVVMDPRVSAGTMERGGDALRAASAKNTQTLGGAQADFYTISNY